ncbi:MAG: hypothetical protein O2866_02165 [archaeon]|nr:hypothetical protein [archaeon]MDA0842851.1 hypothetical protein [archaeon]MDA1167668.1 hypothetical protein [archaeon]
MSRNTNDELPDDLIDKLKLLNERPDDYDADTRPLVPLNEGDIGTFRPPEPALRVGVRDSSYLNYRAWGYISEDERILLSDEGEVYLKMDEETFGSNDALRMMFELSRDTKIPYHKKKMNHEVGIRNLLNRRPFKSVIYRVLVWLMAGRMRP